jgi:hypothetical protein
MQTTHDKYRPAVPGKRTQAPDPDAERHILVTGMTAREGDALHAIADHRNDSAPAGYATNRNAMIRGMLRDLIRAEGDAALAARAAKEAAAHPAPKKRARKGGAQ